MICARVPRKYVSPEISPNFSYTVKIWVLCQNLLGCPVACLKTAPQGCCKMCYFNSPLVFPLHLFGVVTTPKLNSTPRVLPKVLLQLHSSVSTAPFGVVTTPKLLPSILMALLNSKNIDISIYNKIISLSTYNYSHFY